MLLIYLIIFYHFLLEKFDVFMFAMSIAQLIVFFPFEICHTCVISFPLHYSLLLMLVCTRQMMKYIPIPTINVHHFTFITLIKF